MWILRATDSSGHPPIQFLLSRGVDKTIGRGPVADFIVDVPLVSRLHCRLTALINGTLQVEDLQSTNGTYVNDRRVDRAGLAVGDRLRIGRLELAIQQTPDSRAAPGAGDSDDSSTEK